MSDGWCFPNSLLETCGVSVARETRPKGAEFATFVEHTRQLRSNLRRRLGATLRTSATSSRGMDSRRRSFITDPATLKRTVEASVVSVAMQVVAFRSSRFIYGLITEVTATSSTRTPPPPQELTEQVAKLAVVVETWPGISRSQSRLS